MSNVELVRRAQSLKSQQNVESTPVTLEFNNLTYEIKKTSGMCFNRKTERKVILNDVSGKMEPGDLVALMGASGAGKSTLLNVLSRRIVSNDGQILINGIPADKSPILLASSCFIQQEDIFFGHITVQEHLSQQARFRIPLAVEGRQERIKDVMDRFSLNKSKNSRIGNIEQGASRGISGGEKKRLSVATELLINPSLIFADEPTSGLDAFMAESVVEVLKRIANSGHTVITTIHQPSSDVFAMFNKLLLLSEGRVVYFGPRLGAIPYFLRLGHPCPPYTNPADFLIEMLAIDWEDPTKKLEELDVWAEYWKNNRESFLHEWETDLKEKFENSIATPANETLIKSTFTAAPIEEKPFQLPCRPDGSPLKVSPLSVISTLLQRSVIATARNPNVVRARGIQTVVTALLGGLVYFRLGDADWYSKSGGCFFMMVNQGFMTTYTALTAFMGEKQIVIRERDAGLYSLATYYCAKICSDLMFQFYLPLIYALICWWMMGLNDSFVRFLIGTSYTFLMALGTSSIGYIIGSFAPNLGVAVALGPVMILPCLLVAGFVIQKDSLPGFWIWLYYLSPFVYSFSGLMRAAFLDVEFAGIVAKPGDNPAMVKTNGNQVLESFAISTSSDGWLIDVIGLLGWIVLGRLLGLVLFVWTNRRRSK